MKERTCRCTQEVVLYGQYDDKMTFRAGREYQVTVFSTYYRVYLTGDWYHYVDLSDSEFEKSFELIL